MTEQVINLSTFEFNGIKGFKIINGSDDDDNLGYSIKNAGDINGDGIDDIIIGAPLDDPNNQNNAGSSYLVFGTNTGFPGTIDVSSLNGINGFTLVGNAEGDEAGRSVSGAGDINGDGIDDLVIGAPFADPNGDRSGAVYVIFGKTSFSSTPTINLSTLDENNGLIINGLNGEDQLGYTVSNAGDINQDGFDDLIIAAPPNAYLYPYSPGFQPGKAYVIFGRDNFDSSFDLESLNGSNGFVINGLTPDDYLGFAISTAGDVNNDGIDDLIIGAHFPGLNGERAGQAFVLFGSQEEFPLAPNLSQLDGKNGFVINGKPGDQLGFSVSSAGDINGDGIDDIIVGSPSANADGVDYAGISYVIFGKDGDFESQIDISNLEGQGFAIKGIGEFNNSGWAVSGVGDVNSDGSDDILVSANNASPNGEYSGQSYVIFGKSNFDSVIKLEDIDGLNGFVINGKSEGDNLGHSVSGGGDVNGDGIFDLILSAPFTDSQTGEAYVLFGINNAPTDVLLSNNTVDENVTRGTVIGEFTTVDPNVKVQNFTYTLAPGVLDNDAFSIQDNKLKINESPDFETKSTYKIRVNTTDQGGLDHEKELTININNIDEIPTNLAPTDLNLTNTSVDENVLKGTVIGTFKTTDPDSGDSFTYTLENEENYPDNNAFIIDDNRLKIKESPDFETKSSYNINVRTTDARGLSFIKELTININNVNNNEDNPTGGSNNGGSNNAGSNNAGSNNAGSNNAGFNNGSLTTTLVQVNNNFLKLEGSNNAKLQFKITANTSPRVYELGVFEVDNASGNIDSFAPGEAGYSQAVLARSQVVFSIISNLPNQFDVTSLNRLLGFNKSIVNFGFYVVENGTTDSIKAGTTPIENLNILQSTDFQITNSGANNFSLAWKDLIINITPEEKVSSLGANLQSNLQGENLDLRNVTGSVNAEFTVYREAAFNNYIGFYKVTDENGGIDINGDGTADIRPGENGYIQAAVNQHLSNLDLTVGNGETKTVSGTLQGGAIYVPFLIVNGSPNGILDTNSNNDPAVYFTYLGANSDRVDHIRLLADNTFGFEDINGGGDFDFNDMIVKVNFSTIA